MFKFRSWNEKLNKFFYWENGEYYFKRTIDERGCSNSYFDWQNAEQTIEPITVDESALGCGLEDLNITDRYEAMMYGFNQAIEKIKNELNIKEQ